MNTPSENARIWYAANRPRIAALLAEHPQGLRIGPATYTAAHVAALDHWTAQQNLSVPLEFAYVLRPLRMWREYLSSPAQQPQEAASAADTAQVIAKSV